MTAAPRDHTHSTRPAYPAPGWLALVLVALTSLAAFAAAPSVAAAPTAQELLSRAEAAWDRAVERYSQDRRAAEAAMDECIAAYTELVEAHGARTAPVLTNLGAAHLLRGDVGRAVLNLRRAERLDPGDRRVIDMLAAARGRVGTVAPPTLGARTADAFLFWRGRVPRPLLASVSAAAWLIACGAAAAAVARSSARARVLAVTGGAVALLGAGLLLAERAAVGTRPAVVVVQPGEQLLRGPSVEVFEPVYAEPLSPGVEAEVVDRQGTWLHVQVRGGLEGWVRLESVRFLDDI